MQVAVLGLGYIGLPTAGMFAISEVPTLGFDLNPDVVNKISQGGVHFFEPGIRTVIAASINSGNLRVSSQLEPADFFIIAVPTPVNPDKTADLSYVESASRLIVPHLKPGNIVVLESTVPPGTTEDIVAPILEESGLKAGVDFDVAFSPERVIPGKVIEEIIENDRVIGATRHEAALEVEKLYKKFVRGRIYLTTIKTAEFTKLIENSFRDVNIAFANEIAMFAEDWGIDVWEAIRIANRHPRVKILNPGPGVGGHCISVDPWFLIEKSKTGAPFLKQARLTNDGMPHYVCNKIKKMLEDSSTGTPKVTLWGVTYKADVEDTRESPSLEIIKILKEHKKIELSIYDPMVRAMPEVDFTSMQESLRSSDLLVILVNHSEFQFIDPQKIASLMKKPIVLDCVNCVETNNWTAAGFTVKKLGNGKS